MTGIAVEIGENLRAARLAMGLTQAELADRIGMASGALISHYETGKRWPSVPNLMALCVVLCESSDVLLFGCRR